MCTEKSYIEILLKEKNIDLHTCLLEDEGHINLTIHFLIEFIYSLPENEILKIENIFRTIDYKNGDIMDFINYIATAMVNLED